jgi:signal transduction histidine kinase
LINRTKVTGRTAFRLAAFVAIIITCTNLIIFAVLYFVISQQLNADLKAHVDEVRKTLADVEGEEEDGFRELATMVSRHAQVAQSNEDIYLLTDKSDKFIAGNVSSMDRFSGWRTVAWNDLKLIGEWPAGRASTAVVGRWTSVKGGYLFVGDGNGDINDAQSLLLKGLLWGIGISLLSSILGGYILGLKTQRRVAEIEDVLNAISAGQLQRRVPRSHARDDIDHVATLINITLERLKRLIDNLRQVSTDIAHDLRTPISRMRQKLEVVQNDSPDIATYRAAVDETIEEIDGIADTFNALLRISEIEAGARKEKFVQVELNRLLENIVDALEAVAEERHHHLSSAIEQRPLVISGDRRLLNQLFVNLLENAIVHCSEGSAIQVALKSTGGSPAVTISDNGPGIPDAEREKVFRRLYRLEKSRTTRGSGLGLSLVSVIAELHGAQIELSDNNPGLSVEVRFQPLGR